MSSGGHAGRSRVVRRLAALLAVAALAGAAAGCGGDDESSGAQTWATDVCSAFADWRDAVTDTGETLRAGPTTADDLRTAVEELDEATQDFADELRELGPPETDSGQQAQETLDELADQVEQNKADAQSAVEDASGVQGVLEAAAAVASILSVMGQQLGATFDELERLDPAGELADAFENAPACESLADGG